MKNMGLSQTFLSHQNGENHSPLAGKNRPFRLKLLSDAGDMAKAVILPRQVLRI